MKKIPKVLKIAAIVFASLLVILISIPFLFKGKILKIAKEQANNNLNAIVQFSDLSLSMFRSFPALNVKILDISIVGKEEFEKDTLMKMKYLSVNVNLMSLIVGDEIKINSIILEEPNILVKVLKNGKANYDIEIPDSTAVEPTPADTVTTPSEPFKMSLKKVELRNANIIYNDKESDVLADLKNLNLKLKGDMTDDITNLDFLLTIDTMTVASEGVAYLNRANLNFDSEIEADMLNSKYTFKENLLKINDIELAFDGWLLMPEDDIDMDLTFSSKKTDFKSLLSMIPAIYQTDLEGIETSGKYSFDGWAKGKSSDTSIPAFGINLLVENARFQYPDLPSSVENINIDVKVTNPGNEDINNIDIKKFHLEMAQNPVDIVMLIKSTAADVYIDGNVDAKIDLGKVKDFYPLEGMTLSGVLKTNLGVKGNLSSIENETFDNFDANGTLEISNMITEMDDMPPIAIENTKLLFAKDYANLENFDAKIGNSDIHLSGKIDNIFEYALNNKLLTATFDFKSTVFDANEFLGEETETPATTSETATSPPAEEEVTTAFEIPNNIDFTLNSTIGKVLYEKLEITDVIGIIKMKESKLSLEKLALNVLQGSMILTANYDSKNIEKPLADFSVDIQKIDIKTTFLAFNTIQKLTPIFENCEGKISAKLAINTELDYYLNPVMNTINASGALISDDIGISNNKLFNILADLTKQDKFKAPSIKDLNLGFSITNGNLEIKPTTFKLAGTVASVEGYVNLDETIKIQLGMMLPKAIAGNLIENFFPKTPDLMIYATVGGTLTDPKIVKFNTSLTDVVKDEVKEIVSDKAQAILDAAKAKAAQIVADAQAAKAKLVATAQTKANELKAVADKEAKDLLDKAKAEGDELVNKAGNPIAKKAAQKAAEELLKVATTKSDKKLADAKTEIDKIVTKANTEGDKLVEIAQKQADKITEDAQKEIDELK